jgi:hypothetical protein
MFCPESLLSETYQPLVPVRHVTCHPQGGAHPPMISRHTHRTVFLLSCCDLNWLAPARRPRGRLALASSLSSIDPIRLGRAPPFYIYIYLCPVLYIYIYLYVYIYSYPQLPANVVRGTAQRGHSQHPGLQTNKVSALCPSPGSAGGGVNWNGL